MKYLVFFLEEQQFGIDLFLVEKILNSVEITPVPNAPDHYLGAIDIHGNIVPVINLRKLLGIKEKETELTDGFMLCKVHDRYMVFLIDRVSHITESHSDQNIENQVYSKMKGVDRIIEEKEKLICIIDIGKVLPFETKPSCTIKI